MRGILLDRYPRHRYHFLKDARGTMQQNAVSSQVEEVFYGLKLPFCQHLHTNATCIREKRKYGRLMILRSSSKQEKRTQERKMGKCKFVDVTRSIRPSLPQPVRSDRKEPQRLPLLSFSNGTSALWTRSDTLIATRTPWRQLKRTALLLSGLPIGLLLEIRRWTCEKLKVQVCAIE